MGDRRSATIMAVEDSKIMELTRNDFFLVRRSGPILPSPCPPRLARTLLTVLDADRTSRAQIDPWAEQALSPRARREPPYYRRRPGGRLPYLCSASGIPAPHPDSVFRTIARHDRRRAPANAHALPLRPRVRRVFDPSWPQLSLLFLNVPPAPPRRFLSDVSRASERKRRRI